MTELEKMQLACKVGVLGLSDLRKLAPIGDLGYENGWYPPFFCVRNMFYDVWLPRMIMKAFWEQKDKYGFVVKGYSSGYAGTDHHSRCEELGLYWHCDSSD